MSVHKILDQDRISDLWDAIKDYVDEHGSGSSLGSSISKLYSTEETRIGTWIDGKPLYWKTLVGTIPNNINNGYVIDDDVSKICHNAYGKIIPNDASPNNFLPVSGISSGLEVKVTSDQRYGVRIYGSTSNRYAGGSYEITIEYTKSTD